MTAIARTFQVRVHQRGTVDPTDLTVDYTLASEIADLPTIPGPVARPLDGRTETQAWTLPVVDVDGALTSRLADGSGRMHQLGRLAEFRVSEDGGATWTALYTGRIAGLTEPSLGRFEVRLADERWAERRAKVFGTSDTTRVWPSGVRYAWRLMGPGGVASWPVFQLVMWKFVGSTRLGLIRVKSAPADSVLSQAAVELIRGDRVKDPSVTRSDERGNYNHLRLHLEGDLGGDREIYSFDTYRQGKPDQAPAASLDASLAAGGRPDEFWIVWPSNVTDPLPASSWYGYLHASGHETTDRFPLHVGVQDPSHVWGASTQGIHPFALARKAYEAAGIRCDPAAFAALEADSSYHLGAWRVTRPENVASWLEQHVFKPLLVLPFTDNLGRIAPKSMVPPANLDTGSLFVFNASNTKAPYPTWDHQDGEMVNAVEAELDVEAAPEGGLDAALDGLSTESETRDAIRHDTVDPAFNDPPLVPERLITINLSGWQSGAAPDPAPDPVTGVVVRWPGLDGIALGMVHLRYALHVLGRFGDGPIMQTIFGTEQAASVQAGDWVLIDQGSLKGPNPATNARSGTRLVQVMKRDILPVGYRFEVLDAGPLSQPLSAPTLSAALNASDPRHSVDVTIGNLTGFATVEVAYDAAFTQIAHVASGLGAGVHTLRPFASGRTLYLRARASFLYSIPSLWSSVQTVTTTALSAPTALSATPSGRTARLDWTVAHTDYALMPVLDGDLLLQEPLPAGSDTFLFAGLDANAAHDLGVCHVDPWGGKSPVSSVQVLTGASSQLAPPRRLQVLQGRTSPASMGGLFGFTRLIKIGLELGFVAVERSASHRVQVSTDPTFTEVDYELTVPPGVEAVRVRTPLRTDLLYARVRAERAEFTDSDWSDIVSAYATSLQEATPASDRFPGGWASLTVDAGGAVALDLGSDDPDVDRAYYEVSKAGYPSVDEGDPFVARASLPASVDPGITLVAGETAYAVVRFWNEIAGFGQAVWTKVVAPASSPVQALPPEVSLTPVSYTSTTETLAVTGSLGAGGTGPMEYRYRVDDLGVAGAWSAWAPFDGSENIVITRHLKHARSVVAQVQDAAGNVGTSSARTVTPAIPAIDDGTGWIKRTEPLTDGGYALRGTTSDGHQAHSEVRDSRTSKLSDMFARLLDDAEDIADGLAKRITTVDEATGGGRGYAGLSSTGDVARAVPRGHAVANVPAIDVTTGRSKRAEPYAEGGYAFKATDTGGLSADSGAKDSRGATLTSMFARLLDDLDDITDGLGHGKVSINALTSSQVDLAKAGVVGKYAHNLTVGQARVNTNTPENLTALLLSTGGLGSDAALFSTVTDIEYWTGSAWAAWAPGGYTNAFDANHDTWWSISEANKRFRFVIDGGNTYIRPRLLIIRQMHMNGVPNFTVQVDRSTDKVTWATQVGPVALTGAEGYHTVPVNYTGSDRYWRIEFSTEAAGAVGFALGAVKLISGTPNRGSQPTGALRHDYTKAVRFLQDNAYAMKASSSDRETAHGNVKDSRAQLLSTMFGKNVDDLDDAADGLTYKKILGVASGLITNTSVTDLAIQTSKFATEAIDVVGGAGREDVVLNGDFEQGAAFWTLYGNVIVETGTDRYKGAKSLRLWKPDGGNTDVYQVSDSRDVSKTTPYHYVRVVPGDVLRIRAAYKTSGGIGARIGIRAFDADKAHLSWQQTNLPASAVWVEQETSITVPAACYYVTVFLSTATGAGTGYVWFDEVHYWRRKRDADIHSVGADKLGADGSSKNLGTDIRIYDTPTVTRVIARGIQEGEAADNVAVNFAQPVAQPVVIFMPGGMSYNHNWPGVSHGPVFQAHGLTSTGFTPYLKVRQAPGLVVPRQDAFSFVGGTPGYQANKSYAPEAWDKVYTYVFDLTLFSTEFGGAIRGSEVRVYLWYNNGAGWVAADSQTYANYDGSNVTLNGLQRSIVIDGMDQNDDFGMTDEEVVTDGGGGFAAPQIVKWGETAAPAEASATPSGEMRVPFVVMAGK